MAKRDFYDVLGVSRGAGAEEVKKAYRRKARDLHPDRNKDDPNAEAEFKQVNEAYEILKDPEKKAAYDQFGHAAFEGGGPQQGGFGGFAHHDFRSSFSDVFDDLFGEAIGGRSARGGRRRTARGEDLRYNLQVSLEDAYSGVEKTIEVTAATNCSSCGGTGAQSGTEPATCPTCSGMGKVRAQQSIFTVERTCPTCSGMGQIVNNPCSACGGAGREQSSRTMSVSIPSGVETGTRIRLAGKGEAGQRGGPAGDLYIFIHVRDHPLFVRDGQDLFCKVPVSVATAALGGDIEVPTIDGGRSRVRIPEGSQSGRQMRLRSKGMPALRGGGIGDMFIELAVETPVNLTPRQKSLLREFDGLSSDNNPESSSFLSKVKSFWDSIKS